MASVHVSRWGNSLAVRIPLTVAKDVGIGAGSALQLTVEQGSLVLKPERDHGKGYSLAQLVEGISAENVHEETDWGEQLGRESW